MIKQNVKGDIVYSDQIIKNVAENMGIDEVKVRHVFNFLFPFIKNMSRDPEVFSINLHGIGRIYMCTERWRNILLTRERYNTVSKRQRENHRRLKAKIDLMDKIYEDESKGSFLYTVHKKRASISNYFYTHKKTLKELEEIQNEESRKFDKQR